MATQHVCLIVLGSINNPLAQCDPCCLSCCWCFDLSTRFEIQLLPVCLFVSVLHVVIQQAFSDFPVVIFTRLLLDIFVGITVKVTFLSFLAASFLFHPLKAATDVDVTGLFFFFKCEWIHLNNGWSRMWWSAKQVPVLDDRRSDMSRRNKLLLRKQVLVWSVTFLLTLLMLKSRTVYVKRLQRING